MNQRARCSALIGALLALSPSVQALDPMSCDAPCDALDLGGAWSFALGEQPKAPQHLPSSAALMPVPSNWYREGVDHAGDAWFWREVRLPAGHYALELEGVDYAAEVFFDDERIARHTGYFAPFSGEVQVTDAARAHVVAVRVSSPRETKEAWSLHKQLIKGVLSHHDTRPGGAWSVRGQDANTGGIWGSVRLRRIALAHVVSPRARVERTGGNVQLTLSATIEWLRASGAVARWSLLDPSGARVASGEFGALRPAPTQQVNATATLSGARLWWPRELGDQPLYTLEVSVEQGGARDAASTRIGLRTVEIDSQHRLRVNGVPVFLRGTNDIPSIYLSEVTRALVGRDLQLMRDAHVNAVRVHAHVTAPAFYDLADEQGLLVFQDFPLQWGYDDSPAFAREAARQAEEMVALLDHHPSVVRWTAHNESPWSSDWMKYKYPDWTPELNRTLDRVLADAIAKADPSRPLEVNSASAEHLWVGWYSGTIADFAKPATEPFITEYGAQALPRLDTLRTFARIDQWPLEGENLANWEYHNFQLHELKDIAKVPLGNSVEELVRNTQAYQATLTQAAAEGLRRQKWQPVAGIFQFMFNEHWPSTSWGVVDYLRMPKPGYDALARAYQPVLPIAFGLKSGAPLSLAVVSDRPSALGQLTLRASSGKGGKELGTFAVHVGADEVTQVQGTLPWPKEGQGLVLELRDDKGNTLSENAYAPGYFAVATPGGSAP